jgi:hypothetical protein
MNEEELRELYRLIKYSYENTNWNSVKESLDYITEFIDVPDDIVE